MRFSCVRNFEQEGELVVCAARIHTRICCNANEGNCSRQQRRVHRRESVCRYLLVAAIGVSCVECGGV